MIKYTSEIVANPGLAVFCLVAGLVSLGNAQIQPNPQSQGPSQATADHVYKNIQVLKDIPSDQLLPAMQFITASLGTECGFCHVENHFDQDDKKSKLTARKMMLMMAAINHNNFDGERRVTCNTCHRGARIPVAIPAISDESSATKMQADDEKSLEGLPSATELVSKFIAASGGEKVLLAISSREERGSASFAGREIAIDVYDKAPGKRATFMHLSNGDSVTAFNGQQGWTGSAGHPPREMPSSEVEGSKVDADLQFPLHIREMFPDLRPGQPETFAGHETYQLVSENAGHPRIRLYFDKQTGLLLRMLRYSDSPLGLNPVRVDYSDYRPVDGVQVPYHWTVARPSGQFAVQLAEVKQNVEIDDAKFNKPMTELQAQH